VVISIIAVLIALLLPALSAAKRTAIRATCTANLHSTMVATVAYGADHHGMLPTPFGHGQPWNTYIARGQNTWERKNVGLLHEGEYVDDPIVFYCPGRPEKEAAYSMEPNSAGDFDYIRFWRDEVNNDLLRTSYNYNIGRNEAGNRAVVRLEEYPLVRPFALDLLHKHFHANHVEKGAPAWNVLMPDGSAALRPSKRAEEVLLGYGSTGAGGDWGRFETTLDAILNP